MRNKPNRNLRLAVLGLLITASVLAMASAFTQDSPEHIQSLKVLPDPKRKKESQQAFLEAYKVFMHPRCMNCHPKGDTPLQGDDSHLHTQGVLRGIDGKGVSTLKCKNCHQDTNLPGEHMPPGSPTWSLPPAHLKMVFEGKSPRELAQHFKDNKFTGFKDFEKDMVHHVETEPLVLHSFTYGTRPPLNHAQFVAKVKEWIDKGAEIPEK